MMRTLGKNVETNKGFLSKVINTRIKKRMKPMLKIKIYHSWLLSSRLHEVLASVDEFTADDVSESLTFLAPLKQKKKRLKICNMQYLRFSYHKYSGRKFFVKSSDISHSMSFPNTASHVT